MRCKEKGCHGTINVDKKVPVKVGPGPCGINRKIANPCPECGRLYLEETGEPVYAEGEERAFFDGDCIVYKD